MMPLFHVKPCVVTAQGIGHVVMDISGLCRPLYLVVRL